MVVGYINGGNKPEIFQRLPELRKGERIYVQRVDESVLRFTVDRVQEVPKSRFPTEEVYGYTTKPERRLVSCTGWFDSAQGSYTMTTSSSTRRPTALSTNPTRRADGEPALLSRTVCRVRDHGRPSMKRAARQSLRAGGLGGPEAVPPRRATTARGRSA